MAATQVVETDTGVTTPVPNRFMVAEPEVLSVVPLDGVEMIQNKQVNLDRTLAEWYLNLPAFKGERQIRRSHVQYLMSAMERSTFLGEDVIVKSCVVGKTEYRINGQHTCSAIISLSKAGKTVPNYKIRFYRYRAKSMQKMLVLYASTDRNAPRTVGHQIIAQLSLEPGFEELQHDTIRRLAEGVVLYSFGQTRSRREADSQVRAKMLMTDYREASLAIAKILEGASPDRSRHMRRASVIAAMYATWDVAPRVAQQFWVGVRDGEGLSGRHNPILRLRDYLKESGVADRGSSIFKRKVSTEAMYRMSLHCWNAFREGSEMKFMKAPLNTKERPKAR